jgi:hypothetical protein
MKVVNTCTRNPENANFYFVFVVAIVAASAFILVIAIIFPLNRLEITSPVFSILCSVFSKSVFHCTRIYNFLLDV